jgi:hypothetical protein
MSYNPNIPQPPDIISVSQGQILQNFISLNDVFAEDHVPFFPLSSTSGYHKQIQFPDVPAPLPSPVGTESVIYPNVFSTIQQLFFKNATITNQITGPFLKDPNGYAFIPGGFLVKWGSFTSVSGVSNFSFPSGGSIPAFSAAPYAVFAHPITPTSAFPIDYFLNIGMTTAAGFAYDSVQRTANAGRAGTYFYLAIGAA